MQTLFFSGWLSNIQRKTRTDEDSFLSLSSIEDFEEVLARSQKEPVLLFKHSLTCGLSSRAQMSISVIAQESSVPVYRLIVQQARSLSQEIAQQMEIRHESPQIILVYKALPVFSASHSRISVEAINEAVEKLV